MPACEEVADTSMPMWLGTGAAGARTNARHVVHSAIAVHVQMACQTLLGSVVYTAVPGCFTTHVVLSLNQDSARSPEHQPAIFACALGATTEGPEVSSRRRIHSTANPLLCTGLCLRAPHWFEDREGKCLCLALDTNLLHQSDAHSVVWVWRAPFTVAFQHHVISVSCAN